MIRGVSAPAAARRAMLAHARRDAPLECCGFLLGAGSRITHVLPLRNAEQSPTRFRVAPEEHIRVRRLLRALAPPLEIVGVYHSHPRGDAVPSPSDLAEAMYPEWIYVVVGLKKQAAQLAAFRIEAGRARRLAIRWRRE